MSDDDMILPSGGGGSEIQVNMSKLDQLQSASDRLTQSNEDLAQAMVEYQERARLARRRFRLTMSAIAGVVLLVVVAIFITVVKINQALDDAAKGRAQIRDCITPQGQCYKDGQKRTGEVLSTVNKIIVLAAACAPNYVSVDLPHRTVLIQKCIEEGLTH